MCTHTLPSCCTLLHREKIKIERTHTHTHLHECLLYLPFPQHCLSTIPSSLAKHLCLPDCTGGYSAEINFVNLSARCSAVGTHRNSVERFSAFMSSMI